MKKKLIVYLTKLLVNNFTICSGSFTNSLPRSKDNVFSLGRDPKWSLTTIWNCCGEKDLSLKYVIILNSYFSNVHFVLNPNGAYFRQVISHIWFPCHMQFSSMMHAILFQVYLDLIIALCITSGLRQWKGCQSKENAMHTYLHVHGLRLSPALL